MTKGNIYSLVGGEPVSVLEVAYLVKSMADAELDVKYSPYLSPVKQGPRDVDTFNLGDLAWEPKVALKEGIVKTLSWFGYKVNSLSFKPARYIQDHIASRAVTAPPIATTPMPIYAYEPGFKAPAANVPTSFSPNPYPYINKRNPVGELIKKLRDIVRKGIKTTGALPRITAHSVSPKVSRSLTIGAILAAAVITFVVFPVFQVFSKAEHGKLALMAVRDPSNHFDSEQIKNNLKTATEDFTSSRSYLVKVKWLFKISGKKEQYNATYRLLSSLINFSKSGEELADVVKPMEALWAIIRPDTDETMDSSYFDSAKFSLLNARNTIGLASADFKNISIPDLPEKLQEPARVYGVYLEQIDSGLVLASAVVADLPQILGASSKKTYMVWFQNSNEIRPTGGFIGSYGLLTFENGKLKDLTIDDIYNPDGQIDLRGISVPSPSPIAELLGENGLHLRNSNWSPDFPSSVVAFDDLYYRVTGEDIDGYLAVDLSFAKELINVTGPLFLAAYDEQITSENLYERTQYHSDFNFEAGSDAKRGFLTVLGSKLLEKIFATPKDKISPLLGSIEKSLDERHFQIYFKNSSLNAFLKSRNWDGSLADSEGDYLQVVNANLGGTKANYYVQNTMEYEVDSLTRDGILRGTLALNYKHTGEGDAWPGGPYTNYVRVLTQAGSKLTGAKFIYKDNTTLDIFDRIRVSSVGRYSSFETTFKLEPTSSLTLLLNYDLPEGLSITKDFQDYTMLWQKQSGTHDDVFNFKFNAPFGMTLNQFSSNLEQKNNLVEDTGVLDKDVRYIVKLQ
ncbi:hypothetical protein A2450_02185 [candidate division WWE3 bacterium RIFOXYC2_FULL_40_11]|nr:MAG: hypothetical protein A2450_02185 [candidate division WWE3 bacterium RIFOXYC2_FULL_40_11]